MGITGPTPKPDEKRARRNAPTFETTELAAGDAKPPALPNRRSLHASTRRWWDTWVESPQAAHFLATDWQRLLKIAQLEEDFHRAESAKERSELLGRIDRLEARFGATPEDRLRLRMRQASSAKVEDRAEKRAAASKPSRGRRDPRLSLVEDGS